MGLSISQGLPTTTTSSILTQAKTTTKIDLCSGVSLDGLLNTSNLPDFPDFNLPNMDLPSFKILSNLDSDFLPDFTMFKLDGLKGTSLYNPFECSLIDKLKPDTSNLKYKQSMDKLNNINCNDDKANLNDDKIASKVLETAIGASDCAKSIVEATVNLSNDLNQLGLTPSIENDKVAKTLIGSVVDNKFDVGTASTLLNDDGTILKINEALVKKNSPIGKVLKVSKSSGLVKDKDSIVDYATKLTDKRNIAKFTDSQLVHLSMDASKDSVSKISSLPTTPQTLSNSQSISLFSKANKLMKNKNLTKLIA